MDRQQPGQGFLEGYDRRQMVDRLVGETARQGLHGGHAVAAAGVFGRFTGEEGWASSAMVSEAQ